MVKLFAMRKIVNLVIKYLIQQKLRSIIIILILSIAFASYIIISSTYKAISDVTIQNAIDESGAQDFIYKFPSDEEYQKLKDDPIVNKVGAEWYVGTKLYNEKELLLMYRDENYSSLDQSLNLWQEGRKPEFVNEIALSSDFLEEHDKHVGDKINLEYEKYNFESGEFIYEDVREFTITGCFENSMEGKLHNMQFGLVSEALIHEYKDRISIERVLVSLRERSDIEGQVQALIHSLELVPKVSLNYNLINALGDTNIIRLVSFIINLLIAFSMGLVTYNVLYFNFIHKNRDLGIMRSLGFNGYELAIVVFVEVILYLILAILIGTLIDIGFSYLLLGKIIVSFMNLNIDSGFDVREISDVSIKGIVEAITLLLLTVAPSTIKPFIMTFKISPMDAVRQGRSNIKIKFSKLVLLISNKWENTLLVYAIKNLSRNKKRTIVTILSLSVSIFLTSLMFIINSSTFIDSSFIKEYFVPGDIKVEVKGIGLKKIEKSFSQETLETIKNFNNTKKVNAYKIRTLWAISSVNDIETNNEIYKRFDKEYIQANTLKYNGKESLTYNISSIGAENIEKYLSPEIINMNKPIIVIDKEYSEFLKAKIGDEVSIYYFGEESRYDSMKTIKPFIIGGILDKLPIMNETGSGITSVLMSISDMNEITQTNDYDRFDIWLNNNNELNTLLQLDAIEEIHNKGTIVTFKEKEDQYLQAVKSRKVTQMVFNIIFTGLALISLFNTIITNIMNRERELLTLYAIGITKSEIKKAIVFEGSLYSLISVIMTMPLQVIVCILLIDQVGFSTLLLLTGFNIVMVLVGGIFAQYSYNSVFKRNEIAKLKVE